MNTFYLYSAFDCSSCLNVKEVFTQNWRDILSLSDSNGIQTTNHLVHKRILNYLAKLASFYVLFTLLLNQQLYPGNGNPTILAVEWTKS